MNAAPWGCAISAVVGAVLVSAATPLLSAQGPPLPSGTPPMRVDGPTGTFQIRLPTAVTANRCAVHTSQSVPDGIGGSITRPTADGNTITLATGRYGKPARSLQAVVWCPGYAVALITEPDLHKSSGAVDVALEPLRDIEIVAKVMPTPDGRNLAGLEVRVHYSALWVCGFFNWWDCGGPPGWDVARPRIGADGALRFSVPDFAADSAISRVQQENSGFPWGQGAFRLDAFADRQHVLLEADGAAAGTFGAIAVSSQYPAIINLRPRVR
jgi:hypothetical protein